MLKAFCDRCGNQITNKFYRIEISSELVEHSLNPVIFAADITCERNSYTSNGRKMFCEKCKDEIENCMSAKADADLVRHGQWVRPFINKYGHPCHCCSECGFEASQQDKNYCPNCGAKMDGVF